MVCFRCAIIYIYNINLNLVRNTTIICIKHFIKSIFEMKQFPADLRRYWERGCAGVLLGVKYVNIL